MEGQNNIVENICIVVTRSMSRFKVNVDEYLISRMKNMVSGKRWKVRTVGIVVLHREMSFSDNIIYTFILTGRQF